MPRRKLSEYRSKKLVSDALGLGYVGWSVLSPKEAKAIKGHDSYVVKVDQAVKGRFKKGLVLLGVKQDGLEKAVKELEAKGYDKNKDIYYYEMPEGRHDMQTWGKAFPVFLKWAFGDKLKG